MEPRDGQAKYLYLIRHGESIWNVGVVGAQQKDIKNGMTLLTHGLVFKKDHPLSHKGFRQARELREFTKGHSSPSNAEAERRLAEHLRKRGKVHSSPMLRALLTTMVAFPEQRIELVPSAREIFRYSAERDCVGVVSGHALVTRAQQMLAELRCELGIVASPPSGPTKAASAPAMPPAALEDDELPPSALPDTSEVDNETGRSFLDVADELRVEVDASRCEQQWWSESPETEEELEARLHELWEHCVVNHDDESCVVVTHSNLIRELVRRFTRHTPHTSSGSDSGADSARHATRPAPPPQSGAFSMIRGLLSLTQDGVLSPRRCEPTPSSPSHVRTGSAPNLTTLDTSAATTPLGSPNSRAHATADEAPMSEPPVRRGPERRSELRSAPLGAVADDRTSCTARPGASTGESPEPPQLSLPRSPHSEKDEDRETTAPAEDDRETTVAALSVQGSPEHSEAETADDGCARDLDAEWTLCDAGGDSALDMLKKERVRNCGVVCLKCVYDARQQKWAIESASIVSQPRGK